METSLPETVINCTQCGGELHPDEGQIFLTCPYCSSTIYLDKSRIVFHWYIAPTLDETKARSALARWMSGSQTVKDLDQKASITETAFSFFPIWFFKLRSPAGNDDILLKPAAATAVSEISSLKIPAGDLRRVTSDILSLSTPPSVPLETALSWIGQSEGPDRVILEQSLVHVPLFLFKYIFQGKVYTALVEAATGEVFASIYPAKSEAPFLLAGGVSALVYLCLALFPVIGWASNGSQGLGIGLLLCSGIGFLAGLVLFGLALWVAAKI